MKTSTSTSTAVAHKATAVAHGAPACPADPKISGNEARQIPEIAYIGKAPKGLRGTWEVTWAVSKAMEILNLPGKPSKANLKRQINLRFGGSIAGAGNSKVGADTITFNVSTTYSREGFTCPEALKGTCQILRAIQSESGTPIGQSVADAGQAVAHQLANRCYAASDNRQYADTRKRDVRSQKAFRDNGLSATELAAWMVLGWYVDAAPADMLKDFGDNELRLRWARFNVRGGIRHAADLKRMESIGKALRAYGVHAYTYTSDAESFEAANVDSLNLTVTGSNQMLHNNFVVVPEGCLPAGKPACPGSCANCHICKVGHGVTVYIEQH